MALKDYTPVASLKVRSVETLSKAPLVYNDSSTGSLHLLNAII